MAGPNLNDVILRIALTHGEAGALYAVACTMKGMMKNPDPDLLTAIDKLQAEQNAAIERYVRETVIRPQQGRH